MSEMIKNITTKFKNNVSKKYKDYKKNKSMEKEIYAEEFKKEKIKRIKIKAKEDAKSGGMLGKISKFAKDTHKRNQARQQKEKKETKWL